MLVSDRRYGGESGVARIEFHNVTKVYDGKNRVIEKLNLKVEEGSFTVLVGPSGCGKTTALRMIAGLESVTEGRIFIGGADVTDREPGKRDIAFVFQNYAIYPHMTVRQNIEFGLENARVPKAEREEIVGSVLEMVGLQEYAHSLPSKLSGGQRQRVALARAVSKKPRVFLMDEPLSNLDAKLRNQMRTELIELHQKLGSTFVFVTHDQIEAMTMGQQLVIMDGGKVLQKGTPREVYASPNCVFTAQFIGDPGMNVHPLGDEAMFGFRPRAARFSAPEGGVVRMGGRAVTREILGADTLYCFKTPYGRDMVKSELDDIAPGDEVQLYIPVGAFAFFEKDGRRVADPERERTLMEKLRSRYE